jgi:hypothetical protein
MVRKLPAYMTEILLGKGVKWNKQTNRYLSLSKSYCYLNVYKYNYKYDLTGRVIK